MTVDNNRQRASEPRKKNAIQKHNHTSFRPHRDFQLDVITILIKSYRDSHKIHIAILMLRGHLCFNYDLRFDSLRSAASRRLNVQHAASAKCEVQEPGNVRGCSRAQSSLRRCGIVATARRRAARGTEVQGLGLRLESDYWVLGLYFGGRRRERRRCGESAETRRGGEESVGVEDEERKRGGRNAPIFESRFRSQEPESESEEVGTMVRVT
ncbi:hypothetical protein DFH09DRAFT_1100628 [Mycena vulgaris]|nr:hypothetical protein DFH09DRAFT_1100628 [Mycena vulgaris]